MGKVTIVNKTTEYRNELWYINDLHKITNIRSKFYNNLSASTKNINDLIIIEINNIGLSIKDAIEKIEKLLKSRNVVWNIWA